VYSIYTVKETVSSAVWSAERFKKGCSSMSKKITMVSRMLILLLTVVMAFTCFAGCKKDDKGTASTDASSKVTTSLTPTEEIEELYATDPNIPATKDLGGKTITFGMNTLYTASVFPDEGANELGDRQIARMRELCAAYNCIIEKVDLKWDSMVKDIMPALLVGDEVADVILPVIRQAGPFIEARLCENILKEDISQYIDLTMPWWNDTMTVASGVGGAVYCATPQFTSAADTTWVCYFNRAIASEIGLNPDTLYEMQANKTWTWDEFAKWSQKAVLDRDNDGKLGEGDRFGYASAAWHIMFAFLSGAGVDMVVQQQDGTLKYNLNTSHAINALTKINELMSADYYRPAEAGDMKKLFSEGDTLFMLYAIYAMRSEEIRNMEDTWGVVLLPLGPSADGGWQKEYHSRAEQNTTCIFFPTGNEDLADTALVVEALAFSSWKKGVTDIIELSYLQYTKDEGSQYAIDEVFNVSTFAYDQLLFDVGGSPSWHQLCTQSFFGVIRQKAADISYVISTNEAQFQSILDNFYGEATQAN